MTYVRCSSHSLKFTNKSKLTELKTFVKSYKSMVKKYVNILWNEFLTKPPKMLESEVCNQINTNNSFDSRIRQCAAKQACSIVNGTITKHTKRLYVLNKLREEGKDTIYLQRKISLNFPTKPKIKNLNVELDPRFVDIRETNNHFDIFIKINQIGNKINLFIPIKNNKISNKWSKLGTRKSSISINDKHIRMFYEVEKVKNNGTRVLGADQGALTCLSLSDGQVTKKDKDGHDLSSILNKISKKKKGTK